MKYWLFDGKDASGPYDVEELKRLPGFTAESVIAPDGAVSPEQWKPAQFYLIRPPTAKPYDADAPAPGKGPRMGLIAQAEMEQARVEQPGGPIGERSLTQRPRLTTAAVASVIAALLAVGGGLWLTRSKAAKKPSESAPAMPMPMAANATPEGGQGDALPRVDEAMQREAVEFVKTFPLQSEAAFQPTNPADVLEPGRWRAPKTVAETLERRGLQALAVSAAAEAQRRGKNSTQAKRELAAEGAAWRDRAQRWLQRNVSLRWDAEPIAGSRWKVSAARVERRGAPEEVLAWEADLLKRTLRPLDLEAWLAVDAKGGGRWADENVPLGDVAPPGAAAQAAPSYEIARPRAHRGPKPEKPGAKGKSPAKPSGPADDIGDEDLGGLDEPVDKPAPPAQPRADKPYEEPAPEEVKPSALPPKPAPKPQAAPKPEPRPEPKPQAAPEKPQPKPADKPAPKANEKPAPEDEDEKDPKHKNAMEMSVDELRQYLNRDGPEKQFQ